jgi:hypothetical protein
MRGILYKNRGFVPLLMCNILHKNLLPSTLKINEAFMTIPSFKFYIKEFISSYHASEEAFSQVRDVLFRIYIGKVQFCFCAIFIYM